jgi:hypothetical protein
MSRPAYLNQLVAGVARPAGKIADWPLLFAWAKALPRGAYPRAANLVKDGVAQDVQRLEGDLLEAFLAYEPNVVQRAHVEALLLAVLGRDPEAVAVGFADHLPLPDEKNGQPLLPSTILERAVRVGKKEWDAWTQWRRRREYLLLEFYDAALADTTESGRNERLAAAVRLLAKENRAS